ncbi:MAG: hypothetical protein HS111_29235 [Kofleriaceae bacterium]|nr:hypothetical protein [Kofleriaceae bacterium]
MRMIPPSSVAIMAWGSMYICSWGAGVVRALEDAGGPGHRRLELVVGGVALADEELLEDVVVAVELDLGAQGVVDREHRRLRRLARASVGARGQGQGAGGRGDERERLVDVLDPPAHRHQRRLVRVEHGDVVLAQAAGGQAQPPAQAVGGDHRDL